MQHLARQLHVSRNRFQHRGYPRSFSWSMQAAISCLQIDFSIAATPDPFHAAPCPAGACKSQSASASRSPPSRFVHFRAACGCGGKCAPVEVIPDLTGAMTYIHSADPLTHTIQPKQESRKKAKTLKECSWAGGLGKQATQSGRITCCTPKPHHMKLGGAHIARLVTRRRRSTLAHAVDGNPGKHGQMSEPLRRAT